MSSGQGYRHTQDSLTIQTWEVNEISLTKSYNTVQVVHYTHLAKNYFEEFMLTGPN
jgi:hypothetical protein